MPTYEYECEACGHRFEKFQSITAAPIRKCPKCGKNRVKRLIGTGSGLIFKGGGFYVTDYRSEAYKDKAKAESASASPASDAKPAAAGDAAKSAGDGASKPAESKPGAKPEAKPARSAGKSAKPEAK